MCRLHDNGVCKGGKPEGGLVLFKTRKMIGPGGQDNADTGESRRLSALSGLRVSNHFSGTSLVSDGQARSVQHVLLIPVY